MTETQAATPAPMLVPTGDERAVLDAFLDFHRGVVTTKAAGLDEDAARRRLVPSQTTLAGLIKHLTVVEREWFPGLLLGEQAAPQPGHAGGWELDAGDTVDALLAEYRRACDESRRAAADLPLDHAVPHPLLGRVNLRWIYVHVIEETARHVGHADILREQTDGATGVLG
jgi:hypothetical protein